MRRALVTDIGEGSIMGVEEALRRARSEIGSLHRVLDQTERAQYVLAERLSRLDPAYRAQMERIARLEQQLEEQKRTIARLESLAAQDPLTGLLNARGAAVELERALNALQRGDHASSHQHDVSVLVMDLNWFKQVNDCLGHAQGDIVLRTVADHLRHAFRPTDIIFRSSDAGDEFVAYLIGAKKDDAMRRAETLAVLMESDPVLKLDDERRVTISVGIAHGCFSDKQGATTLVEDLREAADKAMYQAKEGGRHVCGIEVAPPAR